MKFKRDDNGKLDSNGKYDKKKKQVLNCKYKKECRLGLGCAVVSPKANDGETFLPVVGKRCLPFNYSEKVLLSVSDYEKKMAAEFLIVKNLTAKAGYWVETNRPNGVLYLDDPINLLKGVGKVMLKKLLDSNFKTLSDLKGITNPDSVEITGVPKSKFKNIWTLAQGCLDVKSPPPVDHRKSDNPYFSKFGDRWETQLRKSSAFSHCVVITEYIEFMME